MRSDPTPCRPQCSSEENLAAEARGSAAEERGKGGGDKKERGRRGVADSRCSEEAKLEWPPRKPGDSSEHDPVRTPRGAGHALSSHPQLLLVLSLAVSCAHCLLGERRSLMSHAPSEPSSAIDPNIRSACWRAISNRSKIHILFWRAYA